MGGVGCRALNLHEAGATPFSGMMRVHAWTTKLALVGALALLALPPAAATNPEEPPMPCLPEGFAAEPLGVVIHLTWNGTDAATSYNIYRAKGDGEFRLAILMEAGSNETFDTQVERGVTYRYKMTAVVDGHETEPCAVVTVTAGGPCAPDVSAVAKESSSGPFIHLTWTAVVVAESYNVYRAEGDGELEFLASTDASTQGYIDADVEAGAAYSYEVRAVIEGSERPACGTVTATAIPDFPTVGAAALAGGAAIAAYAFVARRRRA